MSPNRIQVGEFSKGASVGHVVHWLVLGLFFLSSQPVFSTETAFDKLTIYTEHNPPFNYHEDGNLKGASIDTLVEVFKRLKVSKNQEDFIISPWARGYNETQRRKNTMLFATVRTEARENLFKWVGPISATQIVILTKANHPIEIQKDAGLNIYKYGVSKDSRGEQILLEAGAMPSRLVHVNSHASAVAMLSRGRYDAWVRDITAARWTIQHLGFDVDDFSIAHSFDVNFHYFAFSKDTDDRLISVMQQALDTMRDDGTLQAINKKHLNTTLMGR